MNIAMNKSMSNKRSINGASSGYTLVELMIGLVVGLIVGTVAITFMITSSRSLARQSAEDSVQENARFALEILASSVRLAGANSSSNPQTEPLSQGIFRTPICGTNNDCNENNTAITAGVVDVNQTTSASDTLALEFISTNGRTCTGQTISGDQQVVTRFYVADQDNDGVSSLYCEVFLSSLDLISQTFETYVNTTGVALVEGVEMLQVQYGVDTDGSGRVDRYLAYDNVAPDQFDDIKAIRLGLLVSNAQDEGSANLRTEEIANRTYTVFDGQLTANDAVLRQVVSTTVFLPNSPSNIN